MTHVVAATLLASTAAASAGDPAPVLSAATDTARGPTSATLGVSTTIGAGTCSWVVLLTADATPTGPEIEAGQKSGGAAAEDAGSKTVTGTGAQTFAVKPTMLEPSTGYKAAFVHRSAAGVLSNVLVADGFTTAAVVVGTIDGGAVSTTNPTTASGSVSVAVGDSIVAVSCEQSATITTGPVTDNLGNTYTAQNAGLALGTTGGHSFYSIATAAGTLTAVNFAATASVNDIALKVVVFAGPFGAIDANPANSGDATTSFTGPASGTLTQPSELVVGWIAATSVSDPITANAPWTMAGAVATGGGGARRAAIAHQNVEVTTSLIPSFAGTSANCMLGTLSFTRI